MDELDLVGRERASAARSGGAPRAGTRHSSGAAGGGFTRGSCSVAALPGRRAAPEPSSGQDEYYTQIRAGSARSAAVVAASCRISCRHVRSWTSEAEKAGGPRRSPGSERLLSRSTMPRSPRRRRGVTLCRHDLRRPIGREVGARDLVVCLEVAEHSSLRRRPPRGGALSLAPAVLFSAAVPGQGGRGSRQRAVAGVLGRAFRAPRVSMLGRASLAVLVRRSSRVVVPAEPALRNVRARPVPGALRHAAGASRGLSSTRRRSLVTLARPAPGPSG